MRATKKFRREGSVGQELLDPGAGLASDFAPALANQSLRAERCYGQSGKSSERGAGSPDLAPILVI